MPSSSLRSVTLLGLLSGLSPAHARPGDILPGVPLSERPGEVAAVALVPDDNAVFIAGDFGSVNGSAVPGHGLCLDQLRRRGVTRPASPAGARKRRSRPPTPGAAWRISSSASPNRPPSAAPCR